MTFLQNFGFASILSLFAVALYAQDGEQAEANAPATKQSPRYDRKFPEKQFYTKEEVFTLREVLDQKENQLNQDLETQREYIESLNAQVADHLAKIEAARQEIAEFMNQRNEKEENKLKKLARFYEAMEAEQASPLLLKIQNDLAIKIFDRMDTKKAGAILALFPPIRAAQITSNFPRLKLQADKGEDGG